VYLILSLAFFITKPVVESVTHRPLREAAKISLTNSDGTPPTAEQRREIEQGLPARIFGSERLIRAASDSWRLNRAIDASFPRAMFVLLPVFALLTKLAWRRKQRRYPAHLYLALHLHAAWFGALAVATVINAFVPEPAAATIGVLIIGWMAWYALVALRTVFGDSWGLTVAKTLVITPFYLLTLVLVSLALLAYAIFTM
jgi:hypothetical protein